MNSVFMKVSPIIILWVVIDMAMACTPENGQPFQYIAVKNMVSRGILFPVNAETNELTFLCKNGTMMFEADSRKLLFNGLIVWLNAPLTRVKDEWCLVQTDIVSIIYPLAVPDFVLNFPPENLILLDPGHGGSDGGAVGKNIVEKEVVLDIAKIVKQKLTACHIATVMSREDDRTISLSERVQIASRNEATAFVSIHLNSSHNPDASGVETFVLASSGFQSTDGGNEKFTSKTWSVYDQFSIVLAYCIHSNIVKGVGMVDRGIKRSRFEVLRTANCPAVLLECGFVSNPRDEQKLCDLQFRTNLAEAISTGIIQFVTYGNLPSSFIKADNNKAAEEP